jgi:putative pyruvate formate lyase activating enzyme
MALELYRSVAAGKRLPAYVRTARRRLGPINLEELDTHELWALHDAGARGHPSTDSGPSLLDLKIELAERMLGECRLCEHQCGVDRRGGEAGICGVGTNSRYFFEQIIWGEEAPLNPSHEVFFSGCNMRCKFCYSWETILDPGRGMPVLPEEFGRLIGRRRREGALNVNLIGGEPTVHLPSILRSLGFIDSPTAVVWNSNFLMSQHTVRLLNGIVDLYVGDFRFGNDACAQAVAGTDGYFEAAARNFRLAAGTGDVIVRHLVLPGHVDCCLRPIAEWMAENLPETPFNLMFQYMPFYEALNDPMLCRSLTPQEECDARRLVLSLGLNISRWNRPLPQGTERREVGSGEISTTIIVRPDGRVAVMHLHSQLMNLARALKSGGDTK